jgi:DedD protein
MPSREPEFYKDKIEVSLDGRQIFYLFFGGAAIAGLVFVIGVMVGRRIEARSHLDRAETQPASDPLAALDRLEGADSLSFHGAIAGNEAPTDVEKAIGELEKRRAEPTRSDKSDVKRSDAKGDKPDVRTDTKPEAKPGAKIDAKTDAKTDAKPDAKTDAKTTGKPNAKAGEAKGRFTLQLSSFQDKKEAEVFLAAIKLAGYDPTLTEANVNGQGTFYRVRVGSYRSLEAANDAKADYERAMRKTAQVMRL